MMLARRLLALAVFLPALCLAAPLVIKTDLFHREDANAMARCRLHWSVRPYLWAHRWIFCKGKKELQRW